MMSITEAIIALAAVLAFVAVAVLAAHVGARGDIDDVEWQEYRCRFE